MSFWDCSPEVPATATTSSGGTTNASRRPARWPTGRSIRPCNAWYVTVWPPSKAPIPTEAPSALYRSTDEGSRELARWADEITPPAPFVTNEIFAKVVVSILVAAAAGGNDRTSDAATYLQAQRAAHMARMRELTELKTTPGTDLSTVLSADYALAHLDADVRWMTTTATRLTTLTAEVDTA